MAMSDTLQILRTLGGSASIKEMKIIARKQFPEYSFAEYISRDLKKLQSYGKVHYNEATNMWYLIQQ